MADFFQQTGEEFEFQRFLVSRFGSMGALAIRAQYTFRDITQSPPYKEWVRLGKPKSIEELPVGQRGRFDELVAKKPIDPRGEATIPFQFQPAQIAAREKGLAAAEAKGKLKEPPGIVIKDGYRWVPILDLDGNITGWENLGEVRSQEDINFDINAGRVGGDIWNLKMQEFANEQEEKRLTAQARSQLTFGSPLGEAGERSAQNAYKAQLAKQFDETIRDILSSSAPRDWVIRAKAQQALQNNPFVPQESSLGNQWSAAERDLAIEKQDLARLERMIKSGDVPTTKQLIDEYAAKEARVKMAEVVEKHKRKQFEESPEIDFATPKQTAFGNFEVGRPSEAAQPKPIGIPKELSQAFGITKFGQTPARPSGQQWNRATFTAREQLAGYNEALGANWTDVLDQMAMERPQNLTLGRTWQPARSMI